MSQESKKERALSSSAPFAKRLAIFKIVRDGDDKNAIIAELEEVIVLRIGENTGRQSIRGIDLATSKPISLVRPVMDLDDKKIRLFLVKDGMDTHFGHVYTDESNGRHFIATAFVGNRTFWIQYIDAWKLGERLPKMNKKEMVETRFRENSVMGNWVFIDWQAAALRKLENSYNYKATMVQNVELPPKSQANADTNKSSPGKPGLPKYQANGGENKNDSIVTAPAPAKAPAGPKSQANGGENKKQKIDTTLATANAKGKRNGQVTHKKNKKKSGKKKGKGNFANKSRK